VVTGVLGDLAEEFILARANFAGRNRSFLGWYSCSRMNPFRRGMSFSTAGW
jgi:hypothetical protein